MLGDFILWWNEGKSCNNLAMIIQIAKIESNCEFRNSGIFNFQNYWNAHVFIFKAIVNRRKYNSLGTGPIVTMDKCFIEANQ